MYDRDKLEMMNKNLQLEDQFNRFKLNNEKTSLLLAEVAGYKLKVENLSIRFEKLSAYDKLNVEELLALPIDKTECR